MTGHRRRRPPMRVLYRLAIAAVIGSSRITCSAYGINGVPPDGDGDENGDVSQRAVQKSTSRVDMDTSASTTRPTAPKALLNPHTAGVRPINVPSHAVDYGGNHPFETKEKERNLQSNLDIYEPIRLFFHTLDLDNYAERNPAVAAQVFFLTNEALPVVQQFWSSALRVVPAESIRIRSNSCFAAQSSVEITNADLAIYLFADPEEQLIVAEFCGYGYGGGGGGASSGSGDGITTAAGAATCQVDQYNRPTVGKLVLCLDELIDDPTNPRSRLRAIETLIHESAHLLGFSSDHFPYFYDFETGLPRTENPQKRKEVVTCADGSTKEVVVPDEGTMRMEISSRGVRHFVITTPTVVNVARNQFDCRQLTGVRLESQPTIVNDCFGSHWEERHYKSEMMSALATGTDAQYLSPLTLALLEDSGWYRPDYSASSVSPFGHLAGCDFVFEDCIVDGMVPEYSRGSFCTLEDKPLGCNVDHTQIAHCDQVTYESNLEEAYQYFPDPAVGGAIGQLDYCPTYAVSNLIFGSGGEEDAGGNDAGVSIVIDCTDSNLQDEFFTGNIEKYGGNSRCIDVGGDRPHCLETTCNQELGMLGINVGGAITWCEYDFQVKSVPFAKGLTITCPRLAQICPDMICPYNCAGRGICDTSRNDPKCICFDRNDPSPYCKNSPVLAGLEPTISPAPTISPEPTRSPTESIAIELTSSARLETKASNANTLLIGVCAVVVHMLQIL